MCEPITVRSEDPKVFHLLIFPADRETGMALPPPSGRSNAAIAGAIAVSFTKAGQIVFHVTHRESQTLSVRTLPPGETDRLLEFIWTGCGGGNSSVWKTWQTEHEEYADSVERRLGRAEREDWEEREKRRNTREAKSNGAGGENAEGRRGIRSGSPRGRLSLQDYARDS